MTPFIREATADTPAIKFDFESHRLSIAGESWREDMAQFWDPVLAELRKYLAASTKSRIALDTNLSYFNSTTHRYLIRLLKTLEPAARNGNAVNVSFRSNSKFCLDECREIGKSLGRTALKIKYVLETE